MAQGYRGRVFCTPGTKDLSQVVLPDAGRIQEEDARQANKHGYSKHDPALPLFTESDALRALTQLQPLGYERPIEVVPGVSIEFHPAGHLLGSAFIIVRLTGGPSILFGGDLGRYNRPILPDPSGAIAADVVLVESTYGDRDHQPDDSGAQLAEVIKKTAGQHGKLVIPAFAIGRVEELLYWVRRLEAEHRIPVLPVYVDSPMATEALKYYSARVAELDPELRPTSGQVICVRHDAVPDGLIASAVEGAHGEPTPGDRDLIERNGHGRPRAASPGCCTAGSSATRCSSSATRPKVLEGGNSSMVPGTSGSTDAASP